MGEIFSSLFSCGKTCQKRLFWNLVSLPSQKNLVPYGLPETHITGMS